MTPRREATVIAFLAFASMLLAFGIDAALPAFDEIRDEFNLSGGSGQVSLIVTVYFLGIGAGQLFYGPVSDRFGRRPALIASFVIYTLAALGCALSPSFNALLIFRFIWGFGAAGPSVLSSAIARDLYRGDRMARVLALVMAVFLIGPMIAPLIGELLLLSGDWAAIFFAAAVLGIVGISWTAGFGETLAPENRRPIDTGAIWRGIRATVTNRTSGGYIAAMTFSHGAFYVYLGSSQPIVDEIYDRPEWFAPMFAITAAAMGVAVLASSRIVDHWGAPTVALRSFVAMTVTYLVLAAFALTNDGVPSFWIWVVLITITGATSTVVTTSGVAVALEPMARLAGTASAIRGLAAQGAGALLAAAIDRQIDTTITPMAVGGLLYGLIGVAILMWARGGSSAVVDPDTGLPLEVEGRQVSDL